MVEIPFFNEEMLNSLTVRLSTSRDFPLLGGDQGVGKFLKKSD